MTLTDGHRPALRTPRAMARRAGALIATTALVLGLGTLAAPPAGALEPPAFVNAWGSAGSGPGQFNVPTAVALGASGEVYVVDRFNDRVQQFTGAGTFVTQWGGSGSGTGHFLLPTGIAVGPSGDVYVADWGNRRVQRFSGSGAHLGTWSTSLSRPEDLAVDTTGTVYVADSEDGRVERFSATGAHLGGWDTVGSPDAIAVDGGGNVYVADGTIRKYTSTGTLLAHWASFGFGDDQSYQATGLAAAGGRVYATDDLLDRALVFTANSPDGGPWAHWGTYDGVDYSSPQGVAARGTDVVTVDDGVQRFQAPATSRPDGRVRNTAGGALVGDDLYNADGAGQTAQGRAARGQRVTYAVSLQNDGAAGDRLVVRGRGGTAAFTVRYRDAAGTDITTAVTAGTYTTARLQPGQTSTIRVEVTVKPSAPACSAPCGTTLSRQVVVAAKADPSATDTVRTVTTRVS